METSQECKDYAYIHKLQSKNERQLKTMLDALNREITKIKAEQFRLETKLKEKIKKEHFVKDAIMEKWRTPSAELLEAIREVENGEVTRYTNIEEMIKDLEQ